jgi:hypothetical protein
MAVNAEIFPVAAIGRIVVVIMIFVMYGQFMKVFLIELAPAAATDPGMDLERLSAIALLSSVSGPDCIDHSLVEPLFLVIHANCSGSGLRAGYSKRQLFTR